MIKKPKSMHDISVYITLLIFVTCQLSRLKTYIKSRVMVYGFIKGTKEIVQI
jgi:hypothetical protein